MKVISIGDGAWGTTLAVLLANKGFDVTLWSAFADHAADMRRTRENARFLPGIAIPERVAILGPDSPDPGSFDLAVVTVPAQFLRAALTKVAAQSASPFTDVVSGTKGIENDTLARPTEIIAEILSPTRTAVISGPSHAEEVSRELPTTVVAASRDTEFAKSVQEVFSTDRFRVYTSDDALGVELAGPLKNVIAIAAGICDGLGFGDNSKAALLTRGMVEMARLGVAMGAKGSTFAGLAGTGDLIATCFSPFGRNLAVGRQIGKGDKLSTVLERMGKVVAEGVATSRAVRELAHKHSVEMPISEEVYRVLFEDRSPREAVSSLMGRGLRAEEDLAD